MISRHRRAMAILLSQARCLVPPSSPNSIPPKSTGRFHETRPHAVSHPSAVPGSRRWDGTRSGLVSHCPLACLEGDVVVGDVEGIGHHRLGRQPLMESLAKGAAVAGVSAGLFAVLGLPILVELVVVIVLTALLRKHLLDNDALLEMVMARLKQVGGSVGDLWRRWRKEPGEAKPAQHSAVRALAADDPRVRRRRPGRGPLRRVPLKRQVSPARVGMRRPPRLTLATR